MRDVVWSIMWQIHGAIWNIVLQNGSVLREVLAWYEMCDKLRNNGATWNVVSFGMMPETVFDVEWYNVKCGGNDVMRCEMQWQCVIHSTPHHHSLIIFHIKPHFRHSTPYHIPHHIFQYHQITHHMAWCGIVWRGIWCDVECFGIPDVGCCTSLFILMWLWCAM